MDAIKLFHGEISKDLLLKEQHSASSGTSCSAGRPTSTDGSKNSSSIARTADRGRRRPRVRRAGHITGQIGTSNEALDVVRKAIAIRRGLATEPDADDTIRLDLARNLIVKGSTCKTCRTGRRPGRPTRRGWRSPGR